MKLALAPSSSIVALLARTAVLGHRLAAADDGYIPDPATAFYCGRSEDTLEVRSCYEILHTSKEEVEENLLAQESAQAFFSWLSRLRRKASVGTHPDHDSTSDDGPVDAFQTVLRAHEILSDARLRAAYDYYYEGADEGDRDERVFLEAYFVPEGWLSERRHLYSYGTSTGAAAQSATPPVLKFAAGVVFLLAAVSCVQFAHLQGKYERGVRKILSSADFRSRVQKRKNTSCSSNRSNAEVGLYRGPGEDDQARTDAYLDQVYGGAGTSSAAPRVKKMSHTELKQRRKQQDLEEAALYVLENEVQIDEDPPTCGDMVLCRILRAVFATLTQLPALVGGLFLTREKIPAGNKNEIAGKEDADGPAVDIIKTTTTQYERKQYKIEQKN